MSFLLAALAITLVAAVLALAREVRLRRALQRLVRLLLSRWRSREAPPQISERDHDDLAAGRPGDDPGL